MGAGIAPSLSVTRSNQISDLNGTGYSIGGSLDPFGGISFLFDSSRTFSGIEVSGGGYGLKADFGGYQSSTDVIGINPTIGRLILSQLIASGVNPLSSLGINLSSFLPGGGSAMLPGQHSVTGYSQSARGFK